MASEVLTAQQIETLRKALEEKRVASKIAESRVAELEKQIQQEFGVSIDCVPQKLTDLQKEVDMARTQLQEEYAEFGQLWATITNAQQKTGTEPQKVSTDW